MERGSKAFWILAVFFFALLDGFAVALFVRIKRERDAERPAIVPVKEAGAGLKRHAQFDSGTRSSLNGVAGGSRVTGAALAAPVDTGRTGIAVKPLAPDESCAGGLVYRIETRQDGSRAAIQLLANGRAVHCGDGWRE